MVARSSGGSKSGQGKAQHEAEELKKTHVWTRCATRIVVCICDKEGMFCGVVLLQSKGAKKWGSGFKNNAKSYVRAKG